MKDYLGIFLVKNACLPVEHHKGLFFFFLHLSENNPA
jgi:hypothetical protein